jgi:GDPmannose 4,6-dehydratase
MSTRRALITGITGQDGSYLAELLLDKGYEVVGLVRRSSTVTFERIAHLQDRITLVPGDLIDQGSLISVLSAHRPHELYNLAAQSHVRSSFGQPVLTGEVTGIGVARLLEAVRIVDPEIRVYQASTSEMFGSGDGAPQGEDRPIRPRSPYGVAKAYAHLLTVNYRETYGMHCSCGIAFNHESPRRGTEFLTRRVAIAVAAISRGLSTGIALGDLSGARDWGFAGDYVEAMWRMVQRDEPGDLVLATGTAHGIEELVSSMFAVAGLEWRDFVRFEPSLSPPSDIATSVGDPTRALEIIGWRPPTTFEQLVEMMVEAELARP